MSDKAPNKHVVALTCMAIAGAIMAGVGLVTLKQSNIIAAVGIFVATFAYWRNHRALR
ncbi:MAG: hypothetical protein ACKOUM_03675 [Sphingopyxis sp.]